MDPQLEARLHEDFEDPEARRAYATALRQRGDPRGELMLLALETETYVESYKRDVAQRGERYWGHPACDAEKRAWQITDEHWRDWFGDLEQHEIVVGWQHGVVRSLEVFDNLSQQRFTEILSSPPMEFLETLDAGRFRGHFVGVKDMPSLRHLVAPLFTALDPRAELHRFGAGLTLVGTVRELRSWKEQISRTFPGAKLRPRLPKTEIDSAFSGGEAFERPKAVPNYPQMSPPTVDRRPVRNCGACAGDDTRLLLEVENPYNEIRSVLYEYVCNECGWYTHYSHFTSIPEFPKVKRTRASRPALMVH